MIFITQQQLLDEVRSLLYLAYVTNRSVIIPNILGNEKHFQIDTFRGRVLWPSFRVPFFKDEFPYSLDVLEPAYYWRIARDYFTGKAELIPRPKVLNVNHFSVSEENKLTVKVIEEMLLSPEYNEEPRIVLSILGGNNYEHEHFGKSNAGDRSALDPEIVEKWAMDSVGGYRSYEEEFQHYGQLPKLSYESGSDRKVLQPEVAKNIIRESRLCAELFRFDRGNRSCFNKCD